MVSTQPCPLLSPRFPFQPCHPSVLQSPSPPPAATHPSRTGTATQRELCCPSRSIRSQNGPAQLFPIPFAWAGRRPQAGSSGLGSWGQTLVPVTRVGGGTAAEWVAQDHSLQHGATAGSSWPTDGTKPAQSRSCRREHSGPRWAYTRGRTGSRRRSFHRAHPRPLTICMASQLSQHSRIWLRMHVRTDMGPSPSCKLDGTPPSQQGA